MNADLDFRSLRSGYEAVRRLADQDQLACCGQGRVELAAALHRKMREGALTASAATLLLRQVQHDKCAKGGGKRIDAEGMPGAGLTEVSFRKALSGMLALKPYWGKPAVRDFRGDDETSASFEARFAPWSYSTLKNAFQSVVCQSRILNLTPSL